MKPEPTDEGGEVFDVETSLYESLAEFRRNGISALEAAWDALSPAEQAYWQQRTQRPAVMGGSKPSADVDHVHNSS